MPSVLLLFARLPKMILMIKCTELAYLKSDKFGWGAQLWIFSIWAIYWILLRHNFLIWKMGIILSTLRWFLQLLHKIILHKRHSTGMSTKKELQKCVLCPLLIIILLGMAKTIPWKHQLRQIANYHPWGNCPRRHRPREAHRVRCSVGSGCLLGNDLYHWFQTITPEEDWLYLAFRPLLSAAAFLE